MLRRTPRTHLSTRGRLTFAVAAGAILVTACGGSTENSGSGTPTASSAPSRNVPEPGVCTGCMPPLAYQGGPVMATSGLTLTAVYWGPSGYDMPADYMTGVNQYLTDIAAASGATDNTYAIATEYDQSGSAGTGNIQYKFTAGSPIVDTTAFPATDPSCPVSGDNTACVTKDQIKTELNAQISSGSLTTDLNHIYLVFLPPHVATTDGKTSQGFCGYHDAYSASDNSTVVWADEPFPTTNCYAGQSPTGNPSVDAEVSTLSHEIIEAATDPLPTSPSWVDGSGNEIGDECSWEFGDPLGSTDPNNAQATEYNQVINGHDYYTQEIFSNSAFSTNGQGKGCILQGSGSASQSSNNRLLDETPSAQALVDLSDVKVPADGTSTSTVTDEIVDGTGEPVSGSRVHFDVENVDETQGACGTVNPTDDVTNSDGDATTTYTASKSDAECIVVAIDDKDGASDWATVYQGSTGADLPAITDGEVPDTITPGSGAQTFTVTVKNPGSDAIPDARYDVFLSGDDGNGQGLTSAQVHISYTASGDSTSTPLSLDGETTNNGDIEGDAMPDSAHSIAAGATDTVTFTITIDSGAPLTSATGSKLTLEVDLDQYNPADDSTDNLDWASGDITIG